MVRPASAAPAPPAASVAAPAAAPSATAAPSPAVASVSSAANSAVSPLAHLPASAATAPLIGFPAAPPPPLLPLPPPASATGAQPMELDEPVAASTATATASVAVTVVAAASSARAPPSTAAAAAPSPVAAAATPSAPSAAPASSAAASSSWLAAAASSPATAAAASSFAAAPAASPAASAAHPAPTAQWGETEFTSGDSSDNDSTNSNDPELAQALAASLAESNAVARSGSSGSRVSAAASSSAAAAASFSRHASAASATAPPAHHRVASQSWSAAGVTGMDDDSELAAGIAASLDTADAAAAAASSNAASPHAAATATRTPSAIARLAAGPSRLAVTPRAVSSFARSFRQSSGESPASAVARSLQRTPSAFAAPARFASKAAAVRSSSASDFAASAAATQSIDELEQAQVDIAMTESKEMADAREMQAGAAAASASRSSSVESCSVRCRLCFQPSRPSDLRVHPGVNLGPPAAVRSLLQQLRICAECAEWVEEQSTKPNPELLCILCHCTDGWNDVYGCARQASGKGLHGWCLTCLTSCFGSAVAREAQDSHPQHMLESTVDWACPCCRDVHPRKHLAVVDLMSDIAALTPQRFINPFTLDARLPLYTYHTPIHPHYQPSDASEQVAEPGAGLLDPGTRDAAVGSVQFSQRFGPEGSELRGQRSMPITEPPTRVVSDEDVDAPLGNGSALLAASAAAASSSSALDKPLLRIVSVSMYRHDSHCGVHGAKNLHVRYVFGLLGMVANFQRLFPASERWVLRIYWDDSLTKPCPCKVCVKSREAGGQDAYQLPEAWRAISAHLRTLDFVQLRRFNFPCYQHRAYAVTDRDDGNSQFVEDQRGFHLGHFGMLARFLALAELGVTAEMVLLSDVDGRWTPAWKKKLDEMWASGASCMHTHDPDYAPTLWGGASAFAFHARAHQPLRFPGLEVSLHEFAAWHMSHPDELKNHPLLSLHWNLRIATLDKEAKLTAMRQSLREANLLKNDWTDADVEREYLALTGGSKAEAESAAMDAAAPAATSAAAPVKPSAKSKRASKTKRAQTEAEALEAHEQMEAEASQLFPYGADQAFLAYFVLPVVQNADQLTEAAMTLAKSGQCAWERSKPNYVHTLCVDVQLPECNKKDLAPRPNAEPKSSRARPPTFESYLASLDAKQVKGEANIVENAMKALGVDVEGKPLPAKGKKPKTAAAALAAIPVAHKSSSKSRKPRSVKSAAAVPHTPSKRVLSDSSSDDESSDSEPPSPEAASDDDAAGGADEEYREGRERTRSHTKESIKQARKKQRCAKPNVGGMTDRERELYSWLQSDSPSPSPFPSPSPAPTTRSFSSSDSAPPSPRYSAACSPPPPLPAAAAAAACSPSAFYVRTLPSSLPAEHKAKINPNRTPERSLPAPTPMHALPQSPQSHSHSTRFQSFLSDVVVTPAAAAAASPLPLALPPLVPIFTLMTGDVALSPSRSASAPLEAPSDDVMADDDAPPEPASSSPESALENVVKADVTIAHSAVTVAAAGCSVSAATVGAEAESSAMEVGDEDPGDDDDSLIKLEGEDGAGSRPVLPSNREEPIDLCSDDDEDAAMPPAAAFAASAPAHPDAILRQPEFIYLADYLGAGDEPSDAATERRRVKWLQNGVDCLLCTASAKQLTALIKAVNSSQVVGLNEQPFPDPARTVRRLMAARG